ncbi:MAG: zinc-dependent metalloprotease [Acidimicrobiales bacterium]
MAVPLGSDEDDVGGSGRSGDATARRAGGAGLIDWSVAERVATRILSRRPAPLGYRQASVQDDFVELTAQAEELVAASTGWRAPTVARAVVTDRPGWVRVNVASMQRLLGPTLRKYEEKRAEGRRSSPLAGLSLRLPEPLAGTVSGAVSGAGRTVSGAQLGAVLSWMSTRVLGQYDLLITEEMAEDQDVLYYVGPNVVSLEARFGFPPREFRLWLALHEVTHRCQFTAVPWLRDHFLALVDQGLEPFRADPRRLVEMVRRVAEQVRAGESPLEDAGMIGIVAGEEQMQAIRQLQALMSLLEGHGDVVMDRAGAAAVPGAQRFGAVLRERREQARGPAKVLQRLLGLEAKFRQYAEGEAFVHAVEAAGGTDLMDIVWQGPAWLPSLAEIREPDRWIDRVRAMPAAG